MQLFLLQVKLIAKLSTYPRNTETRCRYNWSHRLPQPRAAFSSTYIQDSCKTDTAETPSSFLTSRDRSSLVKAQTHSTLHVSKHTCICGCSKYLALSFCLSSITTQIPGLPCNTHTVVERESYTERKLQKDLINKISKKIGQTGVIRHRAQPAKHYDRPIFTCD